MIDSTSIRKQRLLTLKEEIERYETRKWDHSAVVNQHGQVCPFWSESECEVSECLESD